MPSIIPIILIHYLLFIILDFGIVFAYLQRSDLSNNELPNTGTNYLRALTISLPGPFGTLSIIKLCKFPIYGWTLLPGESEKSKRLYEQRIERMLYNGKYDSIWRDL